MQINKKKLIRNCLIIIALVILVIGILYIKNASHKDSLVGTYDFTESAPGLANTDQPTMIEDYQLVIKKDPTQKGYQVLVTIDGYQNLQRLTASAVKSGTKLIVVFNSYTSQDSMKLFQPGDVLFELDVADTNKLKISWDKMQPNFDNTDKENSFFSKTQ